jgi:hypothetical protein
VSTIIKVGGAKTAEEAFNEGYDARCEGVDESRNPYPPSDDKHLSWNDGFNAAAEEAEGEC